MLSKNKKKDTFKPCPAAASKLKNLSTLFKGFSTFNQEDLVKMLSKPL